VGSRSPTIPIEITSARIGPTLSPTGIWTLRYRSMYQVVSKVVLGTFVSGLLIGGCTRQVTYRAALVSQGADAALSFKERIQFVGHPTQITKSNPRSSTP
jgi:hypothetical protein